jgi:hypothetical protein
MKGEGGGGSPIFIGAAVSQVKPKSAKKLALPAASSHSNKSIRRPNVSNAPNQQSNAPSSPKLLGLGHRD